MVINVQKLKSFSPQKRAQREADFSSADGPVKRAKAHSDVDRTMQELGVSEQLRDLGTEQPFDVQVDEPPSYDVFEDCFPETERDMVDDGLLGEEEAGPSTGRRGSRPRQRRRQDSRPIVIFPTEETYTGTSWEAILLKWHYRLGHICPRYLRKIARRIKGMEELLKIPHSCKMPQCDACLRAKFKRPPLPRATFKRSKQKLHRLHTDMSGFIKQPSLDGGHYYLVFIDDFSNYKWLYILKQKSQFLDALDQLIVRIGKAPHILQPWKILRSDNAGEMCSKEAKEYYRLYRIFHELCNAYQHWQNPRAEAAVGEIGVRARVMLAMAGAKLFYWGFAAHYACDIDNRCLPYKAGSDITCWEAWFGEAPDNSTCYTWGCRAYVYRERKRRVTEPNSHHKKPSKFADAALTGVFLGFAYHLGHKGSVVLLDDMKTLVISTHVTCVEGVFPFKDRKQKGETPAEVFGERLEFMVLDNEQEDDHDLTFTDKDETAIPEKPRDEVARMRTRAQSRPELGAPVELPAPNSEELRAAAEKALEDADNARQDGDQRQEEISRGAGESVARMEEAASESIVPTTHWHESGQYFDEPIGEAGLLAHCAMLASFVASTRGGNGRAGEDVFNSMLSAFLTMTGDPDTYNEAMKLADWEKWKDATDVEWESIREHGTFEWEHPPKGVEIISSRMVYSKKTGKTNQVTRYKARMVARGFQQREGIDFSETFSPTAHPVSVRALVALSAMKGWKLTTSDVRTAYLNAELEKPVYMTPPPGFERDDGKVMKLKKCLYGLKISAKRWHETFVARIKAFGFTAVTSDNCMFKIERAGRDGKIKTLVALIVVDNCLMATDDEELRQDFLKFLREEYTVTDDGELDYFLGVGFDKQQDGSWVATQTAYIERCVDKFGLRNAKPSLVPMERTFTVTQEMINENATPEEIQRFQSIMGCLVYASIWTRPDIAYAVNVLSRYLTRPSNALWKAAKKVLVYLFHTRHLGIRFTSGINFNGLSILSGYVDASDADCLVTRRSTGGHVLFFGSSPTSWKCGQQKLVTLSTAESELVQVSMSIQEIKHMRDLLDNLGFPQETTRLYEDNQATIQMSENSCNRGRTKHMGRRYAFVREAVEDKECVLVYCPTDSNIADIFTKPLAADRFIFLRQLLLNYVGYLPP